LNKKDLTLNIKQLSQDLNFDLVGVASSNFNDRLAKDNFQNWIDSGYSASMHWLANRSTERKNINKYFPEVKTVLSFGYNYYTENIDNDSFKISNYAKGKDYHIVIKDKLFEILSYIKSCNENVKYRVCVDTSPIMEKNWAQIAGLGWIGKHTNLINNNIGSWFFISEILLDIELDYDIPFSEDLCGTCTKCLDACPTDALSPYVLDSNKCISYLTIEHRGAIDSKLENKLDGWIYGCDICQDVCPWNIKFSKASKEIDFYPKEEIKNNNKDDWKKITKDEFNRVFKDSAIKRTKYEGLIRNINLNSKD
tara:strand:+ start:43 stop:969 length:927 start_codon:yes stop_codon:yes gene_type:complete